MGRVLASVLLLTVVAGCVYVGLTFRQSAASAPDPALAVPADAVAVLRFEPDWRRTPTALHALGNLLSDDWGSARNGVATLDSLRLIHPSLQELLDNGPFGWSLHNTGPGTASWIGYLGVRPTQEANIPALVASLLNTDKPSSTRPFRDATIETWGDVHLSLHEGLLLTSPEPALLEAALARLHEAEPTKIPFEQRLEQSGRPATALFTRAGPSSDWTALEFRPRQGRWEWVGMEPATYPSQRAPLRLPYEVIPANAQRVEWYAHSSADALEQDANRLADVNRLLADLDEVCTCDYKTTHFSPQQGFGWINLDAGSVLIMAAQDTVFAKELHSAHAEFSEAYAGIGLYLLNEPYQASLLTGQPGLQLPLTWAQDGWVLFAANSSTAKAFIRESTSHRTLDLTSTAVNSEEARTMELNHLIWERSPSNWSRNNWPLQLPDAESSELLTLRSAADGGGFVSVKWMTGKAGIESPDNPSALTVRWEQELRHPGRGKPWMVRNHYTGARELLIQNTQNELSLFSASGQRLWSAGVDGPIMGQVQQVDILRNGKLQLAFSTPSSIYILDRNGRLVDGFPIRLPEKAASPVAIFDYDNNRKYRLVIGTADGVVRNYGVDGSATGGWKSPRMDSPVVELEHLQIRGKDYVFAREETGDLHLLKRNGNVRYKTEARTPGHNQHASAFVLAEGIESSAVLYADTAGNIVQIPFNQPASTTDLVGVMEGDYLLRADLNSDGNSDFVLADGTLVKAYDDQFERLFRTEVTGPISATPQVFRFSTKDRKIGVTVGIHNELFLLDQAGELEPGFPIEGNSAFSIGDMDLDGQFELATFTAYGTLKVYQLP